jgi:catalase
MVAGLMNVAAELAQAVATGLGMRDLPAPLPKVLDEEVTPEVTSSPALSLFARPGEAGVRARRVAILVDDESAVEALQPLIDVLTAEGAVPRLVGPRLGAISTAAGASIDIDTPIDALPSVLWDAVIVPDGGSAATLSSDGRAVEFVKDQYRHCKPMLVIGSGAQLLRKAGIPTELPDGSPDPGLLIQPAGAIGADLFLTALARHRHFERETDPPRV